MSAGFDMARVVRSWLREDEHDSADHVLEIVLSRLDATPQRRPMWPSRRFSQMSRLTQIGLAAAAIVVVAVVGIRFLGTSTGAPSTSPPTPRPTPTVAPSPTPQFPTLPTTGDVPPGTYLVTSYTQTPFLVTVPAGWNVQTGMLATGDFYNGTTAVLLRPWIVTHVYPDSCHWKASKPLVGPSKGELVAALTAQTGHPVEGPTEVTLGRLAATRFVISIPAGFDASPCDDGYMRPWPNTGGNEDIGPPLWPGTSTTVYVVETNGKATAIQAARYDASSAADVAALQAMVDSIVFLP